MLGRQTRPIHRATGLGLTLVMLLGSGHASGQTPLATFPASKSPADVALWLQRATPIAPAQVVDLNAASVTAIAGALPTQSPRGFQAQIRAEALDPDLGDREGILSWSITVDVDCEKRVVRLGDMTGYPGRDLRDAPRVVRRADPAWVNPAEQAPLGSAIRALCDTGFQRPLAGLPTQAALAAPPPPVAAPPPRYTPPPIAYTAPRPAQPVPTSAPARSGNAALYAQMRKPITTGGGSISVQVGASPSQADVKALLSRVQRQHASQLGALTTSVGTVTVGQQTVYRALISDLRTNAEANALCQRLQTGGQACFIRR